MRSSAGHLSVFSLACLMTIATAFGQQRNKKPSSTIKTNRLIIDSSTTAIIAFDKRDTYVFDDSYKPGRLTQQDLAVIDSLLIACVNDYNSLVNRELYNGNIELDKNTYRKQLVAVTNKLGQKEVWVNCMCETNGTNWRTYIPIVRDGGNCYFNFKINLVLKKFYDLRVNGVA